MSNLIFVAKNDKVDLATMEENMAYRLVINFGISPELIRAKSIESSDAQPNDGIVVNFDKELHVDVPRLVARLAKFIPADKCTIKRGDVEPAVFKVFSKALVDEDKIIENWKKANTLYDGPEKKFIPCAVFCTIGERKELCIFGSYIPKNDQDLFNWKARVKSLCQLANLGQPEFEH